MRQHGSPDSRPDLVEPQVHRVDPETGVFEPEEGLRPEHEPTGSAERKAVVPARLPEPDEPEARTVDGEVPMPRSDQDSGAFRGGAEASTGVPMTDVPVSDRGTDLDTEDLPGAEVTAGSPGVGSAAGPTRSGQDRLVPAEVTERLRDQWRETQSMFVDDPPRAVARARTLFTEYVQLVATQLDQRGRRTDASTEDLRLELRQYRRVLDQLAEA